MKKIFIFALICGSLMCGGFTADAKKKKSSTKAKTTATASIRKNANEYIILTGHTYKANMPDGTSYTFTFKSGGSASLKLTAGGRSQTVPGLWEQDGDAVGLYDNNSGALVVVGEISDDGKYIYCQSMYGEDINFKLVR